MTQPTPDSIQLVQAFMDDEQEPMVRYLALIVGAVMEHNYKAVADHLELKRAQFEAAGAGELLADFELEMRAVFEPFLNVEDDEA
jgi:hypothetical protein